MTDKPENVKKENKSRLPWTIPLSLIFGVLALIRTCGKDWFRSGDLNGARLVKSSEEIFERTSAEAKLVLEKLVRKSGPYFLYTNDTSANLRLLPNLDMDNPIGIAAFKYVNANKSLRAFIDHPDSARLNLYIISRENAMGRLLRSGPDRYDSTRNYLFFRAYDPTLTVPFSVRNKTSMEDTVVSKAFDVIRRIRIDDPAALNKAISGAFPGMAMMLANVKLRPLSYKIYLAARTGPGMDEALFRKAMMELNKQMNAAHVDTTAFRLKIFNK